MRKIIKRGSVWIQRKGKLCKINIRLCYFGLCYNERSCLEQFHPVAIPRKVRAGHYVDETYKGHCLVGSLLVLSSRYKEMMPIEDSLVNVMLIPFNIAV